MNRTKTSYRNRPLSFLKIVLTSFLFFILILFANRAIAKSTCHNGLQWASVGGKMVAAGEGRFSNKWSRATRYFHGDGKYWKNDEPTSDKTNGKKIPATHTLEEVTKDVWSRQGQITVRGPGYLGLFMRSKGAGAVLKFPKSDKVFHAQGLGKDEWLHDAQNNWKWYPGEVFNADPTNPNLMGGWVPVDRTMTLDVWVYNPFSDWGIWGNGYAAPKSVEYEFWFFPIKGGKVIKVAEAPGKNVMDNIDTPPPGKIIGGTDEPMLPSDEPITGIQGVVKDNPQYGKLFQAIRIQGNVQIDKGYLGKESIEVGDWIKVGDIIVTGAHSRVKLINPVYPGSLRIGPNSRVKIIEKSALSMSQRWQKFKKEIRFTIDNLNLGLSIEGRPFFCLDEGTAYIMNFPVNGVVANFFEYFMKPLTKQPIEEDAPAIKYSGLYIENRGTIYSVTHSKSTGEKSVSVVEGEVIAICDLQPETVWSVKAGEKLTVDKDCGWQKSNLTTSEIHQITSLFPDVKGTARLLTASSNRDMVGRNENFRGDGKTDAIFRAQFSAPNRTVTAVEVSNTNGLRSVWDTRPNNRLWLGGVVIGGRAMNRPDGSVNFSLGSGQNTLDFFVEDNGSIRGGKSNYRMTIFFASGDPLIMDVTLWTVGQPGGGTLTEPMVMSGNKPPHTGSGGTGSGGAGGNLLTNPSFEQGKSAGSSYVIVKPGSTDLPGWQITGDSIDVTGSAWKSSHGLRAVDIHGSGPGGVRQSFPTTPGKVYRVSFDLAGNPWAGPQIKTLHAEIIGVIRKKYRFSIKGRSAKNMGWTKHSFTFQATQSISTLHFFSTGPAGNGAGPAIDNVVVMPVPPGTVGQLGGIRIESATYGGNCGVAKGNVTAHIAGQCNGKSECRYTVDHKVIGDPAFGCAKAYIVRYQCGYNPRVFEKTLDAEAGLGNKVVLLECADSLKGDIVKPDYTDGKVTSKCGLGKSWDVTEVFGWTGRWTRQGNSNVFDALWTLGGKQEKAVLTISINGNTVTVNRKQSAGSSYPGQECTYKGTLAADNVTVTGTYGCAWNAGPFNWQATIRCDSGGGSASTTGSLPPSQGIKKVITGYGKKKSKELWSPLTKDN